MLEARHFTIFIDHMLITYSLQQKPDKCSPRQFNHLDFVAQFTTDIRHITGQDNVVPYALFRVECVTGPPSYKALAASRAPTSSEHSWGSTTALQLENWQSPVRRSPSTAIPLPADRYCTFLLPEPPTQSTSVTATLS
jgi:hypothetical protein